jgi:transposase
VRKMRISVKVRCCLTQRRLKLIDMVIHKGFSIVRAAKLLELKSFTARSIISKFRKEGLVYDLSQQKFIAADQRVKSPKSREGEMGQEQRENSIEH